MRRHPSCTKPDRDNPKMVCGYPMPCPHHTFVVEDGRVRLPTEPAGARTVERVRQIAKALKK